MLTSGIFKTKLFKEDQVCMILIQHPSRRLVAILDKAPYTAWWLRTGS